MTDESKREKILRQVRALHARAQSTTFEPERESCLAKADQLMEAYAIETWMLETGDEEKAKRIERRDFDMSWWGDLGKLHWDAKSNVYHLFNACVRHCRCFTTVSVFSTSKMPVYGLPADLDYLNLLFTDLFIQLFAQLRPKYDPSKSMGENVMVAKEAGMKYTEIAVWLGHPEWRVPNGTGGYKTADNGKMLREYKAYLKTIGKTPRDVVTVHPDAWAISYTQAFYSRITARLRNQIADRASEQTGSMELVLRDIRKQAEEALWADFPNLRPHPADCSCKDCKKNKAVTRYRQGHAMVAEAYGRGAAAGESARIVSDAAGVKSGARKQIGT